MAWSNWPSICTQIFSHRNSEADPAPRRLMAMPDVTQARTAARRAAGGITSAPARGVLHATALRTSGLPVLGALVVISIVLATASGAVAISPLHTLEIVLNQTGVFHLPRTWAATDEIIITQIRLPRVAGAALVGA